MDLVEMLGENPSDAGRLRPELRPYYRPAAVGDEFWPMLRHPLVYQVPFVSWKLANDQYEARSKWLDECLAAGDVLGALVHVENPYSVHMIELWEREGRLVERQKLRDCLVAAWPFIENPEEYGNRRLVRLFQKAGFTTDHDPVRSRDALLPAGTSAVYHGVEHGARGKLGVSWTFDRAVARWFAGRFDHRGDVYQATVNHADVLAVFVGRGEEELIVDPKKLTDVKVIERSVREHRRLSAGGFVSPLGGAHGL